MDVTDERMQVVTHDPVPASRLKLIVAFLLSGLACGFVIGLGYYSFLLFAFLAGYGIPITLCLVAILAIKIEQSTVYLITNWRPAVPGLILAVIPAVACGGALKLSLHADSLIGYALVAAAGLVVQALILHVLASGNGRNLTG